MKLFLFLILPLYLITACTSDNSKSPEKIGKLLIEDLLSRPDFIMYNTGDVIAVHYAEACAGYGALKLAGFLGDQPLVSRLTDHYNKAFDDKIANTANHVDANVFGILPLEIYMQNGDEKYLKQGIEFSDGQWKDTLLNGLTSQARYWIDDIYMIGCLQVQAYRASGEMLYLDRAALVINSYIDKLQQPNGLFYHGPEAPFFWGRGNGWVAAGLAELLSVLPDNHPRYKPILEGYTKMMKTLVKYQSEDGMWQQLLDVKESFKETSSTAMFGFAIAVGIDKGLLPKEPYYEVMEKAWNALTQYLEEDGKIREICVGTGQSKDTTYYLARPRMTGDLHGQAPMLWFAYSLMKLKNR